MATIAMCVAVTVISSWITVPFLVNFSLQTMSIFIIAFVFGLKKSMISLFIYILLGVIGLPVFSGFGSGVGVLLGPTGGFIMGFVFIPPIIAVLKRQRQGYWWRVFTMLISIVPCYVLGTVWYGAFFAGERGVLGILLVCVIPFLLPEFVKILLSAVIVKRLNGIQLN